MAKQRDIEGKRMIAINKKARIRFEILDTLEAGLALQGTEVKALRQGNASLAEAFARTQGNEIYLIGLHISEYSQGNRQNHEPTRKRKLLLHRSEISKLVGRVSERGNTLVPLSIYFKDGRAKVELALARGRHTYDKRAALREKEDQETARRAMRARGGVHRR